MYNEFSEIDEMIKEQMKLAKSNSQPWEALAILEVFGFLADLGFRPSTILEKIPMLIKDIQKEHNNKELKMNIYSNDSKCVKCGCQDIDSEYLPHEDSNYEHDCITRLCNNCGYIWDEKSIDCKVGDCHFDGLWCSRRSS